MSSPESRLSPEMVDLILTNVADGVFTVDPQFRITFLNPAAEQITGVSNEEAIGKPCAEVFRAELCGQDCPLRRSLRTGEKVRNVELEVVPRSGQHHTVSVSTAPLISASGQFLGGVETFRDLSEIKELRREMLGQYTFADIVAKNPRMRQVVQRLPNIAHSDATVLMSGRAGTGKEVIARAIHSAGPRAHKPFVKVSCGRLPDSLFESELFGEAGLHGAAGQKPLGRFSEAHGGTLLLDDVADMPPALQLELLHVLEHREVLPRGAGAPLAVDVRLIAATKYDLEQRVRDGQFREDLYYRLNVVALHIPDLRDRPEDIPLLVDQFIERCNRRLGRSIEGLTREASGALLRYPFPGNVRELENALEHAHIVAAGTRIGVDDLPPHIVAAHRQIGGVHSAAAGASLPDSEEERERRELVKALEHEEWSVSRTARELDVHRTTLWRKMRRLKINRR